MTALPSHRCKQRARRAKHCPISRGWWLTTDRQSAWTAVVHCRPRSVWRHYECRQDWQVDASTHGTAPYCCLSSPCVAIRWTRLYVYSPLLFSYLMVTSNYCDAVRHQFTRPAVRICCLCSGQQYSPPSPLQPALTSPPPPCIPFTAVDGCSEWNAGGEDGYQPAPQTVGRACWIRWPVSDKWNRTPLWKTGTGYPVTVLQP